MQERGEWKIIRYGRGRKDNGGGRKKGEGRI